jgi:colicin import membrane protein
MIATAPQTEAAQTEAAAWSPGAKDHLAFQWVKFGGKTQEVAAHLLGVSQPTVSRMIERYERWQAHAGDREGGRLDPAERLRAQRWLTYERNELLLGSCLRIAAEMEGSVDVSRSVVARPFSQPASEREIRTEWSVNDRHGIAARFLRLAFRINMEQLKLVSQEAPPKPQPLTAEELAQQASEAEAIAAELEAVERARAEAAEAAAEAHRQRIAEEERLAAEMAAEERAAREMAARYLAEQAAGEQCEEDRGQATEDSGEGTQAETDAAAVIQAVNEMNNHRPAESAAKSNGACTCAADRAPENSSLRECITPIPRGSEAPAELPPDPHEAALETLAAS